MAQKRKDDAIRILEQGQKMFPQDFHLHKAAAIAHALLWSGNQYDFDPDAEWFDSPANPDHKPLEIRYTVRHISYCGRQFSIKQPILVAMTIVRDDICVAVSNGVSLEFDYDDVVESRFNGGQLFLDTLLDAYLLDILDPQQSEYLNAVVDESVLTEILHLRTDVSAPFLDSGTIEQITLSDGVVIRVPDADVIGAGETPRDANFSALMLLSAPESSSVYPPYNPDAETIRKKIMTRLQEGSRSIEAAES